MRLKRLELLGFKSFADRTVVDFGADTLTGIVGPNGCGKSNVVDSVRWVLGETRPTSLRGAGMTDVIFKGSSSRPAMSVAEVTLVVENDDGAIEGRGAEVAMTRRLYRSGEGEYLIDGERVRLKDVRDMLFDTGLGSRGYSVLEQGRIDAVLSANPVQRRAVFEEAAGISRYRQRKHETELRLARVEQDVARLDDVMGELRTRVRSLKIQAGKAERFVEAREEWTREKTRLFRLRRARMRAALAELAPRMAELEARLSALREARAAGEARMEEGERERSTIVLDLDRLSAEASDVSGELRAVEERRSQLQLRITELEALAEEQERRGAAHAGQLEACERELEAARAELGAQREHSAAAEEHARKLGERLRELGRGYKDVRKSVQEQNDAVLGKLHEKTVAQNRARHLAESRSPAGERHARLERRHAEQAETLAAARVEVDAACTLLARAREELAGADAALERHGRESAAIAEEREALRTRRTALEVDRAQLEARIAALLDREREREDLCAGTRRVLDAALEGAGPCGAGELGGLLADHLRTSVEWARAVDVVLAERARALVVARPELAPAIVEWLRAGEGGPLALLVPAGLAGRAAAPLAEIPDAAGVIGRLADRVEVPSGSEALADALLGDVVAVDSLERALELVRRHPAWRYVTARGELVDAAGIVVGHREVGQGPVGRRSSAADLARALERLSHELAELDGRLAAVEEQRRAQAARAPLVEEQREAARARASAAEAEWKTLAARLEDREAARAALAGELARSLEELRQLEEELERSLADRERSEREFRAENEQLEELERGRRALEEQREGLAREESRAQVERTHVAGECRALERQAAELERRIAEHRAEIEQAETRRTELLATSEGTRGDTRELALRSEDLAAQRRTLEQRLGELRAQELGGRERIERSRAEVERAQGEIDAASEALSERRLELQRLELTREELERRAAEELHLDLAALEPGEPGDRGAEGELADDAALDALERAVAETKECLDKLGPVNMDALAELEEVGGRLDFLERQSEDLARARQSLRETIQRIDQESRRLFVEAFEEIKENFQRIFRQLFGGGRAELALEEGADVLEAGIEISARPPGREMLSIGLLSGGQRTMTALALLFAVFEARPSPFCVLDEVDAALDDANIDRFLAMLDGFRKDTQFIVVTHNKGTMAACQRLYGVTMQTKGVSTFVTVELGDVEEFESGPVPGGNGAAPAAVDAETGERVVEIVPQAREREGAPAGSGTGSGSGSGTN